jgi:antitoxin VapB
MNVAKIFPSGRNQAVRLPRDFRFNDTEIGIARVGEMVVLFPKDRNWEIFSAVEPVTDDIEKAIISARLNEPPAIERESL